MGNSAEGKSCILTDSPVKANIEDAKQKTAAGRKGNKVLVCWLQISSSIWLLPELWSMHQGTTGCCTLGQFVFLTLNRWQFFILKQTDFLKIYWLEKSRHNFINSEWGE